MERILVEAAWNLLCLSFVGIVLTVFAILIGGV